MAKSRRDDLDQASIHRLSVAVNRLIKICAWLTATVFGIFTLWQVFTVGIKTVLSNDSLVWKIIISSYFVSWLVGVQFDKTYEEYVYNTAPRQGKLDVKSIILAALVFFLFGVMYYVDGIMSGENNNSVTRAAQEYLSINGRSIILLLLNILWFFNIPLWIYFVRKFIEPMSSAAITKCKVEKNLLGIEKIASVDTYISGQWQKYRFVTGSIVLILVDITWIWFIFLHGNPIGFISIVVCGYLIVIEAWVWLMRAKMKFGIQALDKLSGKYHLTQRSSKAIRSSRGSTRLRPARKAQDTETPPEPKQ